MPVSRRRLLLVLFVLHISPVAASAQDLVGVYLTWKQDPRTTMTVNWVDLYPASSGTLWHRQVDSDDWQSAEATLSPVGPSSLQLRRIELTGLKPDTDYEFSIGKPAAKPSDGWRFRTMPDELKRPLTFVTGGDMMHSRAMVDAMNKQAAKLNPDFALLGGDLAYANGVTASRWIDWLQSWTTICIDKNRRIIPMVLAIGNHEVRGGYNGKIPDDAPYFYSLFSLPGDRSYYTLDFGDYLSLVILDSEHTQPIAGPQAEWLGEALSARTGQQFLFGCYHYPAYGTTKAPKDKLPIDASRSIAIREHWMPHFERYGMTAIFENDHHNYKRTHRLRGHQRDDDNGILYLGDGAWGVQTRTVPDPAVAWWLAKAEPRNHLWHVELRPDGASTIRAIDDEGKVFDHVDIATPRTRPVP